MKSPPFKFRADRNKQKLLPAYRARRRKSVFSAPSVFTTAEAAFFFAGFYELVNILKIFIVILLKII